MKEYWDKRFSDEGKIWGKKPSNTAEYALKLFKKHNIKTILIPGAGYGRNTRLFSNNGFFVQGIEISSVALEIAKNHDTKTNFYHGSVLDMPFNNQIYDAIYCFNTLHFFLERERKCFLKKCYSQLRKKGFIFFVVFSKKEKSFGNGRQLEENTFESKPGRPTHYFSEEAFLF